MIKGPLFIFCGTNFTDNLVFSLLLVPIFRKLARNSPLETRAQ